ncbi:MAG: putative transposase [Arenicella sp.]|jgi:putative transposase
MVQHPGEYRWSSYGVNAQGDTSDLVTLHDSYLALGGVADSRYRAYRSV